MSLPHATDVQADPPRDFLKEAYAIIEGRTSLLPEKGHLIALAAEEACELYALGTDKIERDFPDFENGTPLYPGCDKPNYTLLCPDCFHSVYGGSTR
jgi:hypothetical protein